MVSIERFSAVIFDFDGVIVDTERLQAAAWGRVAAELGLGVTVGVAQIAGKLDRFIAPALFPAHDAVWCIGRKNQFHEKMEADAGVTYIHETLDLARRLSGPKRMAICSSSSPARIAEVLDGCGERARFEVIVGQVAGEECKPSPAPYLKALRWLNVSAGEACAIEDSHTGITAAKGAGIYTIQLLHEGMDPSPLADAVVRSAAEIHFGAAADQAV